MAKFVETHNDL